MLVCFYILFRYFLCVFILFFLFFFYMFVPAKCIEGIPIIRMKLRWVVIFVLFLFLYVLFELPDRFIISLNYNMQFCWVAILLILSLCYWPNAAQLLTTMAHTTNNDGLCISILNSIIISSHSIFDYIWSTRNPLLCISNASLIPLAELLYNSNLHDISTEDRTYHKFIENISAIQAARTFY